MNSSQIEENVVKLANNFSNDEFIFDLLLAYGLPRATVTMLRKGNHNLSKQEDRIILKNKLFFETGEGRDLHYLIDQLQKEDSTMRHSPRFIIVTDYSTLLSVDTKTNEHLDVSIRDLGKHFAFFLPWSGIEKYQYKQENPADRKAAEKMAKLYDHILQENEIHDETRIHDLNIFLSRLLFCFFAEDTEIFEDTLFTSSIASHTAEDGSDLHNYLEKLFCVLNTKETSSFAAHFQKFPYVNGGLFAKQHWIPTFSKKARQVIIECGELNWAQINPDIFGSMIQAVVNPSERGSLGMHYTSVPNIMKVIEPLFLNELREEFENSKGNQKKLQKLRERIKTIKFFDPACGSGNFLIITYKELRKLEMQIIEELGSLSMTELTLGQFYGIEIDDFAHEVAKLSLYLAEHQMNVQFKEKFGQVNPTLPLKESGNIVCANATRIDWNEVCPIQAVEEVYIFGNPPYLGSRNQDKEQKEDMKYVFKDGYKSLDYISIWFFIGGAYIRDRNARLAFVSTNSIVQGEQVSLLWPRVLDGSLEIIFAHTSFKWGNNAKENAGVTVVIVGVGNLGNVRSKFIFTDIHKKSVVNITPYLTSGKFVHIFRRSKPISRLPICTFGNMPNDGGHLLLDESEKNSMMKLSEESGQFIRGYVGASEFINGKSRWCLWITDDMSEKASRIGDISNRLNLVEEVRSSSSEKSTRELATKPHRFYFIAHKELDSIIIPSTTSERRDYIPIGILSNREIIANSAQAIYGAEPWVFGIISSRMHMTWIRAVCGSLETRIRYSSALGYNTFPMPELSEKQKKDLNFYVYNVLEEREKHSEKTMAQLYDPDKMPAGLKKAHQSLDIAVEKLYRATPFKNDEERLEYLFKLYEQMTAKKR